ncbi:MAG: DUF411 domain-containing protein [Gemmatimonadota bacterium]|nr:DUF411 domain-containing protein [Gemmatimonadota bacterium]MDH4347353.1 DUF411 domain-containing protein [Gemmatimonadota bacterium]MDH5282304.1 DUF411 domain-containing protein [Gemmatimonadota bacterium]
MKLRQLGVLALGAVAVVTGLAAARPEARAAGPSVMVYKAPTCGCCTKWMEYLEANGFTVKHEDMADVSPMKEELGVPRKLVSCHTAVVAGYVIEGHVPAADIQRLLREKPKLVGLSAPGMPGASPGMDTSDDPYEVLAFDARGTATLWAKH